MTSLSEKKCEPCQGGISPLSSKQQVSLLEQLSDWTIVEEHHLLRSWKFEDFVSALAFVNKVGAVAEQEGHHPNISLTWGQVEISIYTHKIDGLAEADFILAAKIDLL